MDNELLYQVALTLVPHIGPVQAKILAEHFGSAQQVFKAKKKQLSLIEYVGEVRAASIKAFEGFTAAEEEIAFLEKYQIRPLFITDQDYPKRLLHCYDAPTLLYYKGDADLNTTKVISIIGTRSNTDYGRQLTEKLVQELKDHQVLVISGLAFGIDAIAHKSAYNNGLPTVGVLAHGLDTIYPSQHKTLAKEMLQHGGGLITEQRRYSKPDKHNFPKRNRIVAGMADATIVVETAVKGGSMITAELANSYNKDVFAFPGRTTDVKSMGCNHLIKQNKAMLLNNAQELLEMMGWEKKKAKTNIQRAMFIDLTEEERIVLKVLGEKDSTHIDELYLKTGLSSSSVAASVLNLELQGILQSLPGKLYRLA